MARRKSLAATMALVLSAAPSAAGAEARLPVLLCGLISSADVEAALHLQDHLATATLVPGDPAGCEGPPPAVRVLLAPRSGDQVVVILEGPAMALERLVPWLTTPADGLARLDADGRLPSFAILLEALLAEYRLTAAAYGLAPDGTPLPDRTPAPSPTEPRPTGTARRIPRPSGAPAQATRPPPKPAAAKTGTGGAALPAAGAAPEPGARVEEAPPPVAPVPPAPVGPAPRRPHRRGGGAPGVSGAPGAPGTPGASRVSRVSRPTLPFGPEPELFAGIRARSPEVVGAEFGLGLRLGSAFGTVRYQPEATWTVDDRPVAVSALGVELGWLHPLSLGEDTRVFGRVAALAERIEVRQLDMVAGARHEALDLGVVLGLALDRRVAGGLWATLGFEGIWEPTAGLVLVEDEAKPVEDWFRVRFNGVGGRATLAFSWRR